MIPSTEKFKWNEIPVEKHLPKGWRELLTSFSNHHRRTVSLVPNSITSRETEDVSSISISTVDGSQIRISLPWLHKLYKSTFLDLIIKHIDRTAVSANSDIHGITINIQSGNTMRYECHVESNPITALLYVNDHPKGSGGELVISNDTNSRGLEAIKRDSVSIYPESGVLYVIQAMHNPHFASPLTNQGDSRIAIVFNYYNEKTPETARPIDLDNHLGLIS